MVDRRLEPEKRLKYVKKRISERFRYCGAVTSLGFVALLGEDREYNLPRCVEHQHLGAL
jgi:hypothetical protein